MVNKVSFTVIMATLFIVLPAAAFAGSVDLPKTGQESKHYQRDDGDIQAGAPWPIPRFKDNGDGTITDNLTGLMWLKDAKCFGQERWPDAIDKIVDFNVNPGTYACQDYTASYTDWALPNINELESLVNVEEAEPLNWLMGQGFWDVSWWYWSSTTYVPALAARSAVAWVVNMSDGFVGSRPKSNSFTQSLVWPVRSGQ
ncbi:MAG: Lcl C-terminal domain-containing protein [Candidatus Anammoxibacter sp.]